MAFKKGQSGNPNGRRRGSENKTTTAAKSAIEMAFEGLGGWARLQEWAKSDPLNERAFYTQIWVKLLPLQVTGQDGKDLIPPAITFVVNEQPNSENQT
jgi:hypothetical protein